MLAKGALPAAAKPLFDALRMETMKAWESQPTISHFIITKTYRALIVTAVLQVLPGHSVSWKTSVDGRDAIGWLTCDGGR